MALNARWDLCRAGGPTPRRLGGQKKRAQQGSPEASFVTNEERQSKQLLPVWKSLRFLLSEDVSCGGNSSLENRLGGGLKLTGRA